MGTGELWLGDLTYVATDEGWVYLSGVSDACSRRRRLLGWSITDHLRTDGPLDALYAAADCRGGDTNERLGEFFQRGVDFLCTRPEPAATGAGQR